MNVHYGHLDSTVVDWIIRTSNTDRIVALDLETKVINGNFLTNETILAISAARRLGNSIKTNVYILKEETKEAELRILQQLDDYLQQIKPLMVVGFNHRGYDTILLATKRRREETLPCWNIKDVLERAYLLDVMHAARFEIARHDSMTPKILPMSKVISHPRFANLPLMRTKSLISAETDKGKQIYDLWKTDRKKFATYASGDAHDSLLIFEELFLNSK